MELHPKPTHAYLPVPSTTDDSIPQSAWFSAGATAAKVCLIVLSSLIIVLGSLPFLIAEAAKRSKHSKDLLVETHDKKPVLIVLVAADDSLLGKPVFWGHNATWRTLEKNFTIQMHKVSNITDIEEVFNKTELDNVAGVWFSTHANQGTIDLNENLPKEGSITKTNVKSLQHTFSKLPLTATIVIDGCEAGKETIHNNHVSIARKIASIAPERQVFAPTKTISELSSSVTVKDGQLLTVEWRRWRITQRDESVLDGIVAVMANFILSNLPKSIIHSDFHTENITARYQKLAGDKDVTRT